MIEQFAGNGQSGSVNGPTSECSFRQPCGLAVEFDNVVFTTDVGSGTVQVISPISNTIEFLEAVGGVYKAFSVQEKGAQYHKYDLKSALRLVERCRVVLEPNEEAIVQGITTRKLPKS